METGASTYRFSHELGFDLLATETVGTSQVIHKLSGWEHCHRQPQRSASRNKARNIAFLKSLWHRSMP